MVVHNHRGNCNADCTTEDTALSYRALRDGLQLSVRFWKQQSFYGMGSCIAYHDQ